MQLGVFGGASEVDFFGSCLFAGTSSGSDSLDSLELTTLRPRMTELGGVGVGLGGSASTLSCWSLDWWSVT